MIDLVRARIQAERIQEDLRLGWEGWISLVVSSKQTNLGGLNLLASDPFGTKVYQCPK